jgi:hypothetical protein
MDYSEMNMGNRDLIHSSLLGSESI